MVELNKLKKNYTHFEQAIEEKDFIEANAIFQKIDLEIRKIEDFSSLSSEEIQWLTFLNQQITSKLPILQQDSKELVAKIKPFNNNKTIKDIYSNK